MQLTEEFPLTGKHHAWIPNNLLIFSSLGTTSIAMSVNRHQQAETDKHGDN